MQTFGVHWGCITWRPFSVSLFFLINVTESRVEFCNYIPSLPVFLVDCAAVFSLSVFTVALLSLPASKFKGKDSKNGEKKS